MRAWMDVRSARARGDQDLPSLAGAWGASQRQAGIAQAQAVAQVQVGVQSQRQFSQVQAALDEAVGWVGVFFMCDIGSSLATEPQGGILQAGECFFSRR